jgi:MFS family permease
MFLVLDNPNRVIRDPLFKQPDFRRFWMMRTSASLVMQIQAVAVGWHVYDLTSDPFALGFIGLVQFLPALLLALPAGQLVDRLPRRGILMACTALNVICPAAIATLILLNHTSIWPIFLAATLLGATRAFEMPAAAALLPGLVERDEFRRAVALNASGVQTAMIAGPALGGLLYALHPAAPFLTCIVLLCFNWACLAGIKRGRKAADEKGQSVTLDSMLAGLRFINDRPILLGAISMDMMAVFLGGATALLPIFARDILEVGPVGLGLLRCAPAIGALGMALLLARRPLERRVGRKLFYSVGFFGAATVVFGLSENVILSFAALMAMGVGDMVSVVIRSTLVQLSTPDAMRGRVSSVNSIFIGASNQLGEFESGVVAGWFGPVPSAVIGGVGAILVAVTWSRWFKPLWEVDSLDLPSPEPKTTP